MIQKIVVYSLMAMALVVMVFSSVRIGVSIVGEAMTSTLDLAGDNEIGRDSEPILPIWARKLAADKGEAVRDVLPRLLQMSSDSRKIDESKLPYKCGVILFYHIPGNGGTAIIDWLKDLKDDSMASYFSSTGQGSSSKEAFVAGVEDQIRKIGKNKWKIIHANDQSLSLMTDEHYLSQWRGDVEKQKCHFIVSTVFQDPLDHSVSHTKKEFSECNCKMEEFKKKLDEVMTNRPWRGQLDYLLFNDGEVEEIPFKDKVRKGIQVLQQNFDLVVLDDHDKFEETILKVTGWSSPAKIKQKTLADGELVFSKVLVSQFGKISSQNGDSDFIDAVNHIYHNELGFLMSQ